MCNVPLVMDDPCYRPPVGVGVITVFTDSSRKIDRVEPFVTLEYAQDGVISPIPRLEHEEISSQGPIQPISPLDKSDSWDEPIQGLLVTS